MKTVELSFRISPLYLAPFEAIFENFTDSYTIFEEGEFLQLVGYLSENQKLRYELIITKINQLAQEVAIDVNIIYKEVEDIDWVMEVQKSFRPITVGKFHVHSSYYANDIMEDKINITVDPGRAFGTGEHETTQLCLEAISGLKNFDPKDILDLGCGSGILAIASNKYWPQAIVMASDIDPISIEVAKENIVFNQANITAITAEGFASDQLKNIKFDLIVANILANPLLILAEDIKSHMKRNGRVILSGFFERELEQILTKYKSLGFSQEGIYIRNNWVSLVLAISE